MPENSIMSISMRPMVRLVEQRLDQLLRLVVVEERAVKQVHADDAERLLLQRSPRRRASARG